jgi:hypothetical protein
MRALPAGALERLLHCRAHVRAPGLPPEGAAGHPGPAQALEAPRSTQGDNHELSLCESLQQASWSMQRCA